MPAGALAARQSGRPSRRRDGIASGAKLIAIDPYRSVTAEKCHEHIALLPGTDGALALGLMHVLIAENLLDRDYIDRYTAGFAELAARAAQWGPERVARACGITAEQVIGLARDYGTIQPAAIRLNYGMQRVHGGGNAVRAVAACPRWLVHGALRRVAPCSVLGHVPGRPGGTRASRPDPRHAAHDQHVGDRRCAARGRRSSDPRHLRLQLESGCGCAGVLEGAPRLCP
jgi:anaerobic selenocysteine-containing dehydrogenase